MRINKTTMLFEDISPTERREMLAVCEDIVLRGKLPWPHPDWLRAWMDAFGFDERQQFLTISTAFPQRVLLSLLQEDPYVRIGKLGGALTTAAMRLREVDPRAADEILELVRRES